MLSLWIPEGEGVKLTVLGCSGPVPRPGQACCGYLLQHDKSNILLDCGSGVLSNLQKHLEYWRVDAIVISHMHADHCFDLLAYRTALRLDMFHPLSARMPLYLPPGGRQTLAAVAAAMGHAEGYFDEAFDIAEYAETDGQPLQLAGLRLTFRPTKHRILTYGVRIEGEATLTYSADSGVSPELADLAKDADLFLCEATFQRETNFPNRPHLKATEAGEIAQQAGAKRLLLTHIWHQLDPRRSIEEAGTSYKGAIEAAQEGQTYGVARSVDTAWGANWQHAKQL